VKRILPLAALLLLAGCSSQTSIWGQYSQLLRESWRNSTGGGIVTMEQAAAIPDATLADRVDGSSELLLVLATDSDGDLLWTSASRVALVTRDGRILRSVGLPHDKGGMSGPAGAPLSPVAAALKAPYRSTRIADFPDIGRYGMALTCTAAARGRQLVTVLGTAIVTTKVEERCESSNPRWSFTDSYWLDPESGLVWQSLQNTHPSGTRVGIKILRPPE
jgi:hypothetical protein